MTDHNNWQRKYSMPHTKYKQWYARRPNTCRNAWITANYSTDCCVSLSLPLGRLPCLPQSCNLFLSDSRSIFAFLLFDLYECGHTLASFACIVYGFVAVSMSTHSRTLSYLCQLAVESLWSRVNKFMQTSKLCSRIWTIDLVGSENSSVSAFFFIKRKKK